MENFIDVNENMVLSTSYNQFNLPRVRMEMNQLCKVCGEPAAGFHFGAFTCEGCKSFFGRTYNNLSQIHECKNGGACVINKQNRTSCKACRLRKCLIVGMSKSGSRYGRRSNWFKIHCLLQEKANFAGQPPSFRSPVTPTLQDGSLPFVASQMRDPVIGIDTPGSIVQEIPSGNAVTLPVSSFSQTPSINASSFGFTDLSRLAPSYSTSPTLNSVERKYHEEILNRPPRPSNVPFPLGASYREHVLNLLQRSQSFEPVSHPQDYEASDDVRVTDVDDRLRPKSLLEWEHRLSRMKESDDRSEKKSPSSTPKDNNLDSQLLLKDGSPRLYLERKCIEESSQDSLGIMNNGEKELDSKTNSLTPVSKEDHVTHSKGVLQEPKGQDSIMTDEERLSFLKSANNTANSLRCSRNDDSNNRISSSLRFPNRDDLLYNPVNNNLFSFPPYPHLWPSMIPFSPFSKFYSPFCPPRVPPPLGSFDPLKPSSPFPLFNTLDQRLHFPHLQKQDPEARKRILDDILQIQRHSKSPTERNSIPCPSVIPADMSRESPVPQVPISIPSSEAPVTEAREEGSQAVAANGAINQPIDLSVRRKRKMDKSEIVYKPGDELEDMESEVEREQKEHRHDEVNNEQVNHIESSVELKLDQSDEMEIKVTEIDHTLTHHSFGEVPLKLIKLESSNETLTA